MNFNAFEILQPEGWKNSQGIWCCPSFPLPPHSLNAGQILLNQPESYCLIERYFIPLNSLLHDFNTYILTDLLVTSDLDLYF